MRLIYARINGYKHLKDVAVRFQPPAETGLFRGGIPIRFFIGLNGSGKSVFLEALCHIFSCLAQEEAPGFDFQLIYEITRQGAAYRVQARTIGGALEVHAFSDGQAEDAPSLLRRRELLPDYVFTCASGSNNNFFDVMVRAPRDALYSELFNVSLLGRSRLDAEGRRRLAEDRLTALRRLEEDPICLFIDEQAAVLALGAFLAVFPEHTDPRETAARIRCRREILTIPDSRPQPVSLSLTLDEARLSALGEAAGEYGPLLAGLYEEDGGRLCDWDTVCSHQAEAAGPHGDRVLTFLFEPYGGTEDGIPFVRALTSAYGEPLAFLSKLILARNQGLIREAHLSFRIQGTEDLLEENALSEGEFMLLVRLSLLAMGRSGGAECQCLYLFDEPDVYLNERWSVDFVSMLHRIYAGSRPLHELLVATHSSLILTDAFPDQLYYFQLENGQARCRNVRASTFGGSRNEIMQALFQTRQPVGRFAYETVESLLGSAQSAEELEAYLESIGSGYLRLRLLDRIQRLREQEG